MSNDNELWHLFAVEAMNSEILWAIRNMDILKKSLKKSGMKWIAAGCTHTIKLILSAAHG